MWQLQDKNSNFQGLYSRYDVNISKIIPHPQYKSPKKYFDIALIELEEEVIFTVQVQPSCFWTEDVNFNKGSICGWGMTAESKIFVY